MKRIPEALAELLGPAGLLVGADVAARSEGWRSRESCEAIAIARPADTAEVSAVLSICHTHRLPVVPYGGGTGLVQGAVAGPGELLLSLERMRRVLDVDDVTRTSTVEAGVTLQQLQQAADQKDLLFPLDLGARGTATIGGNIATNAGGNRVIRFGMMREMVLGLEVVLPDGKVVSSMNRMLKNNTGYDLKQLFIGSEGTLGVVTQAVLRLREKWLSQNLALVSVTSFADVLRLLKAVDRGLGGSLSAFEVMWREFYQIVTTPPATNTAPLPDGAPYYVLIESLGGDEATDRQRFEAVLAALIGECIVSDTVIAVSQAQCNALWKIRDSVEELLRLGPIFMFDVSLPVSAMEEYVTDVRRELGRYSRDHVCVVWGHLGDSNLHLWITVHSSSADARERVEGIVYGPLKRFGGSISAEHGIGVEKRRHLGISRSDIEIGLMRALKKTLDPDGILNPGKILD